MKNSKRILQRLQKIGLISATCLIFLWLALFSILQIESIRTEILQKIVKRIKESSGLQISVAKLEFTFPFSVKLSDVILYEKQQIQAIVNELEVCWFSPSLLQGEPAFPSVKISGLYLNSLDFLKKEAPEENVASFAIKIKKLLLSECHLGSAFIQSLNLPETLNSFLLQSTFDLEGQVAINPNDSHLVLTAKDGDMQTAPLNLTFDIQNSRLALSLHLHHFPLQHIISSAHFSPHTFFDLAGYAETELGGTRQ